MPSPTVGKIVQYLPSAAFNAGGIDTSQLQAGVIIQAQSGGLAILKVWGSNGQDFTINAIEDDTQTTPNSWTYANQTT